MARYSGQAASGLDSTMPGTAGLDYEPLIQNGAPEVSVREAFQAG